MLTKAPLDEINISEMQGKAADQVDSLLTYMVMDNSGHIEIHTREHLPGTIEPKDMFRVEERSQPKIIQAEGRRKTGTIPKHKRTKSVSAHDTTPKGRKGKLKKNLLTTIQEAENIPDVTVTDKSL